MWAECLGDAGLQSSVLKSLMYAGRGTEDSGRVWAAP